MPHLDCAAPARAGARLLAACLLAASCAHAAPASTGKALGEALARNAALPRAPLLAPELFDQPGRLREVRLSPDGAHLAWIEEAGGKAELYAMPAKGGAARPLAALDPEDRMHWSRDSTALFLVQADGVAAIGVRDGAGGRIAVFPKDGSARFAGIDRARPRHVIVQRDDATRQRTRLTSLAADGATTTLYAGAAGIDAWLPGRDGLPAILRRQEADFSRTILWRDGAAWRQAARCQPLRSCVPLALASDGKRLLLRTPHANDRDALVEVTLASGRQRLLHTDPRALADLAGVTLSPRSGEPMLATYQLPTVRLVGLDAEGKRIAAAIGKRFPAGGVAVESCAPDACLLVERGARMAQPRFWLMDLERLAFRPVLDAVRTRAAMPDARHLAERIALHYRASDGAIVHGYLTLPPGLPARGLPLVTLVHGGPWAHVDGGYGGTAQLLANRGFAVFQPNFRGSTGYGARYTRAPGADYGNGRVQADIVDGVRWLLAQGVGDARRLGIVGASFGGYATLLALTHTPDLFRVGMAAQPTPDFARTLRLSDAATPAPGEPPFRHLLRAVGIELARAGQLDPIARDAPLGLAARITAPLLLVAGARDEKIEIELVADYAARLQTLKKPVSVVIDPDEGHHPKNPVARAAQVHLLLQMLHRYLGGPPAPKASGEVARYLARTLRLDGAGVKGG